MRTVAVWALAVALAGCSGAGTPPPAGPGSFSLSIVGLGDSVMAGTGCGCAGPMEAYADLLRRADPRLTVRTRNLGMGGATSDDLRDAVTDDPPTRAAIATADIVVVISGANDLAERIDPTEPGCDAGCVAEIADGTRASLEGALREVRALRGGRPTTVLVTGYWNDFEDGDPGLQDYGHAGLLWARGATATSNAALRAAAGAAGATYVDLAIPFLGPEGTRDPTPLLAADGDHPNADGVAVIAGALAAAHRG